VLSGASRWFSTSNGSFGRVFDHVGIHNSDLAASERFYRTVLSALGLEPSYAGADMVGWDVRRSPACVAIVA
jgi:hypothetical protein